MLAGEFDACYNLQLLQRGDRHLGVDFEPAPGDLDARELNELLDVN